RRAHREVGEHRRNPKAIAKERGELVPRPKQGAGLPWSMHEKGAAVRGQRGTFRKKRGVSHG
ncbi:MAG: hypothetical protein M3O91_03550, partial [Chloroflexota bacterium]|nr:hypothetical protein [Chloroflexota bacterium]